GLRHDDSRGASVVCQRDNLSVDLIVELVWSLPKHDGSKCLVRSRGTIGDPERGPHCALVDFQKGSEQVAQSFDEAAEFGCRRWGAWECPGRLPVCLSDVKRVSDNVEVSRCQAVDSGEQLVDGVKDFTVARDEPLRKPCYCPGLIRIQCLQSYKREVFD